MINSEELKCLEGIIEKPLKLKKLKDIIEKVGLVIYN